MAQISLDRIISVSLSASPLGLANANTSALAIVTDEVPIAGDAFGVFGIYYSPGAVAADWGSDSDVFRLATVVLSQSQNPLSARGFLVIIPRKADNAAQPAVVLGAGPVDLTTLTAEDYKLNIGANDSTATDLLIGAIDSTDLESAQDSLNSAAVSGANFVFELSGSITAANIKLRTVGTGATAAIDIGVPDDGTNLATALGLPTSRVTGTASGAETIRDCLLRVYTQVYFFGIILNVVPSDAELPALAQLVQSIDKILFYAEHDSAKVAGIMTTLKNSSFSQTRGLLYTVSEALALDFAAGYAGRALSTDFTGDSTVSTMHLKDIAGIAADSGLTETIVSACQNAGVDVYADFGVPKVFTSGANRYFDEVYVSLAFKLAIRVAGFNYLATTSTKIPQTEIGMNGLKGAYRKVVKQFVTNGAFAPGAWNGTTFGNPQDFIRNILDAGFYIFSSPIANQTQEVRASRAAPLVQIAAKSAGAIHSSNVILSIEA